MRQGLDQSFNGSGYLSFGIGILHTQEQDALRLMAHSFGGQPLHKISQMNESRRAGGHTGNHGALLQITGRKASLDLFTAFPNLGKQKSTKLLSFAV